jgi:hypothetical protein
MSKAFLCGPLPVAMPWGVGNKVLCSMLMLHGLDGVDHVSKPAKVLICHEGFNTLAWGDHPDIPVALHLPMTFTIWPWLCSQ